MNTLFAYVLPALVLALVAGLGGYAYLIIRRDHRQALVDEDAVAARQLAYARVAARAIPARRDA